MALTAPQKVEAATEVSPLTVLVLGVLSWIFPAGVLKTLYQRHAPGQWERKLTVAAITWLLLDVVTGARRSVHAAYQADIRSRARTIEASYQALYQKYGRLAPDYGTAVVRASAQRCLLLLAAAMSAIPELFGWEGYRVRVIDGTDLDGTAHRLGVLRDKRSAGLPGRFVVCYDPATGLVVDAVASEDAYTSERALVLELIARAQPRDLYVCDRFYCTTDILSRLHQKPAFFVIRQFERLRWRITKDLGARGRVDTGAVSEQLVEVEDPETGRRLRLRRITLTLDTPTRQGEAEIHLLTNLKGVRALRICELYRRRWTIEGHFSFLKDTLHGQIESLGQPRAALFALCLAMVAGNAWAVVRHALTAAHGAAIWDRLSGYYLADELATNQRAVEGLISETSWARLARLPAEQFRAWCLELAGLVEIGVFFKTKPRGPKKPKPKRQSGKRRPHYSTHRLLVEARKSKC
jgi:Transposase DDE domain